MTNNNKNKHPSHNQLLNEYNTLDSKLIKTRTDKWKRSLIGTTLTEWVYYAKKRIVKNAKETTKDIDSLLTIPRMEKDGTYHSQAVLDALAFALNADLDLYSDPWIHQHYQKTAWDQFVPTNIYTTLKVLLDSMPIPDAILEEKIMDKNTPQPYFAHKLLELEPDKGLVEILETLYPDTLKLAKVWAEKEWDVDFDEVMQDPNLTYDQKATFVNDILSHKAFAYPLDDKGTVQIIPPIRYSEEFATRAQAKTASNEYSRDDIIQQHAINKSNTL